MRFNRVRRVANIVVIALLIFLFIVPSLYLSRVTDQLLAAALEAERAAQADDLPAARAVLEALAEVAGARLPQCKLFMDHATVDALLAAAESARFVTEREDILVSAAAIRTGVAELRQIELFSFAALL